MFSIPALLSAQGREQVLANHVSLGVQGQSLAHRAPWLLKVSPRSDPGNNTLCGVPRRHRGLLLDDVYAGPVLECECPDRASGRLRCRQAIATPAVGLQSHLDAPMSYLRLHRCCQAVVVHRVVSQAV